MAPRPRNANARVMVIYTGGTLGMVPSEPRNPASPLVPGSRAQILRALAKYVPDLGREHGIYWELHTLEGFPPVDSCDVNASHWLAMAAAVARHYARWDGFVILHGTDTMAYTASALSFLFENLGKPVVLTGAQLPLSHERTDARLNLVNSLQIAGWKATGLPLVPEVALCFGTTLLRGNRARKISSSDLDGFDSPNYPPLGRLGDAIEIDRSLLRPAPDAPFSAARAVDSNVVDITLFPGIRAELLAATLRSPRLKGALLRTFGTGNIMSEPRILGELRRAVRAGKILLNITQCLRGMVDMGHYSASSELLEMGVISGLDMTPEAALTKMFWLLARHARAPHAARAQLQLSHRGEQSADHFELRLPGPSRPVASYTCACQWPTGVQPESVRRAMLRIYGFRWEPPPGAFALRVGAQTDTGRHLPLAEFQGEATLGPRTLTVEVPMQRIQAFTLAPFTLRLESSASFTCKTVHFSLLRQAPAGNTI
jgi:L-asparaginase